MNEMLKKTLVVLGPGGVGKGPLGSLIKPEVISLDPYRMRPEGPRKNVEDPLYVHPKLRKELHGMLASLGQECKRIPFVPREQDYPPEEMEWYPKARILLFTVRTVWQCLIFSGWEDETETALAKMEVYAPAMRCWMEWIGLEKVKRTLGELHFLVLNPSAIPLSKMNGNWTDLEEQTLKNCQERGDSRESIRQRMESIRCEAPCWQRFIEDFQGKEIPEYQYPEFRFKEIPGNQKRPFFEEMREYLIENDPELEVFLKTVEEL
ncbi:MAG TPA: hypothetical protein P5560_14580 [Thermotogota bacterium]|nr:hypothetical protein [Thermotogota bacterium]